MGHQPKVYRDENGDRQTIASGGTQRVQSGGTLTLEEGAIVNDSRAINKGVIQIGIDRCRILSSDAYLNTIEGGTPDGNTNPALKRVNAATDKMARLEWAASNSDEVDFPNFVYPPDLDDTQDITVHVLAAMAGVTDTPTLAIGFFEGLGDTNAGGNTGAVTGTAIAEYTRTIAAADVGAHPKVAKFSIIPAAHTTDILSIYAAWVEYTKKTS